MLRAVLIFAVLMCAFYTIDYTPFLTSGVLASYLALIAIASMDLLNLLGFDVTVAGTSIYSPGFSVQIARGCDGLEPVAAFIAAVLASPVPLRMKLPGILIGSSSLLVLNLFRVVSLFLVGTYFPNAFDLMHHELGQAAFIVVAVAFWAVWVTWATRCPQQST